MELVANNKSICVQAKISGEKRSAKMFEVKNKSIRKRTIPTTLPPKKSINKRAKNWTNKSIKKNCDKQLLRILMKFFKVRFFFFNKFGQHVFIVANQRLSNVCSIAKRGLTFVVFKSVYKVCSFLIMCAEFSS